MEKLQPVIEEVNQMISLDGLGESTKKELLSIISDALSKKEYVESIKSRLDEILADKKLDASDIPNMMILSIQVNNMLPQLLGLTSSIKSAHVKYIVYGSVYYYIRENKPNFFTEAKIPVEVFRLVFSSMWKLVEFNPDSAILVGQKLCGWCCGGTPVKSSSEPTA